MTLTFDRNKLQPGDDLHVRTYSVIGKLIRTGLAVSLDIDDPRPWGNHDAMLIPIALLSDAQRARMPEGETWCVGDAQPLLNRVTPLCEYERRMNLPASDRDRIHVRVFRPVNWTMLGGLAAADWWLKNVEGHVYNITAYPLLMLRCLVGQKSNIISGWNKLRFCTRGYAEGWRLGAALQDVMGGNLDPTPYTTEKRLYNGGLSGPAPTLLDVSEQTIKGLP